MAANQISNQQRTVSGQGQRGASTTAQSGPEATPEATRDYGSLGAVSGQASEVWNRGEDQLRELIREREGPAILLAVATGVGVGLVLGGALGRFQRRPKSWRDRLTAEGLGRRLMDRIEAMLPDALADHFSH